MITMMIYNYYIILLVHIIAYIKVWKSMLQRQFLNYMFKLFDITYKDYQIETKI